MIKKIVFVACLSATPVIAETWATGDCIIANGEKVKYMVHDSKGFISFDNKGPYPMFTKRENNTGIITYIGSRGNFVLAVDLNTGRGYAITKFDDGRTVENNVSCRLGSTEK